MIARSGAMVVVADGGGASVYRVAQRGADGLRLDEVNKFTAARAERGADREGDRPGRLTTPHGPTSAVEGADRQDREEVEFARQLADQLDRLAADAPGGVILFAAPRFLGQLRGFLSQKAQGALSAEVNVDLRKSPLLDIVAAVERLDAS